MTSIAERENTVRLGVNARNLLINSNVQKNDDVNDVDFAVNYVVEAPFDLIERKKGGFHIFAPKGRLNNATLRHYKDRLYDAVSEYGCKIIFNLKFVESIDSVGLGVLINAHKKANERGGMVVFTNMNDRIIKTMKMLYMDRFLKIVPEMKDAVVLMDW
ncbi:STAS domain-containing protein [Maridesulfovibrio sp. FT414]|uniref:STAS domain-containing protein n=1 Tax=Maridesulfovibrio sp. FT414 TaxID=2979469 RepID=UPI003D803CF3